MKRVLFIFFIIVFGVLESFGSGEESNNKYGIEIFPLVIPFKIYSAQFVYEITPKDCFIIGFTYLNNYYPNKKNAIGQFFAPSIPFGYRRYLWENLNIEMQLWPAYNFYKDLTDNKFYKGFDLVGNIRFGYRFNFNIKELKFYTNIQIEYLYGIYKGNKPDNFNKVDAGLPFFPALSLGYKF